MIPRILVIVLLLLVAEYYAYTGMRFAIRNLPAGWRTGITIAYVVISLLVWAGFVFFRQIQWESLPHLARNIYIAFALGWSIGKLLLMGIMLIDDLRRLVLWVISLFYSSGNKPAVVTDGISRSQFLISLGLGLGGLALGGALYGLSNRYRYRIRRHRVKLPGLPEAFRGLRIVQLSDIHSGSFDDARAVAHGVEMAMQQRPDLIVFTGDLVNNHAEEIIPYKEIFSRLKAPMGVYSTLGNHDYGDYVHWDSQPAKAANLERLKQHHADMGWRLMMNEHVLLEKDGAQLALLGIENWSAKPQFPKYGDLPAAYAGLRPDDGLVKILLSHDPSHWDAQVRPDYPDISLMLAGHTHGMQFGVEVPGFRWSPVQYVYKEWAGLYAEQPQQLYVNRGFGFLGYPGRVGILPEITVLELV